jgi:hypothetical protein
MQTQTLEPLDRELRDALERGALAHRGRLEMSDGVTVEPERMARIVLVDLERIAGGTSGAWLPEGCDRELYDDLLRLVMLARQPVHA